MKGPTLEGIANTGRNLFRATSTLILIGAVAYIVTGCAGQPTPPLSTSQQTPTQTTNSRYVSLTREQIIRQRHNADALAKRDYSKMAADQYYCAQVAILTDRWKLSNRSDNEQYLRCLVNNGFFQ